jgi:hypothetical protein
VGTEQSALLRVPRKKLSKRAEMRLRLLIWPEWLTSVGSERTNAAQPYCTRNRAEDGAESAKRGAWVAILYICICNDTRTAIK